MPWDSIDRPRDEDGQEPPIDLSPLDVKVLLFLAAGVPNKTIAWHLGLRIPAINKTVVDLLKTTKTRNRAHLVAFAIRNGFIAVDEAGYVPRDLMRRAA